MDGLQITVITVTTTVYKQIFHNYNAYLQITHSVKFFSFSFVCATMSINDYEHGNQTALMYAVGCRDFVYTTKLLANPDIDPNKPAKGGDTPLCRALSKGKHNIIKALFKHPRIDVNARNNTHMTPIEKACTTRQHYWFKMLLVRPDTNIYYKDAYNCGLLYYTLQCEDVRAIEILLILKFDLACLDHRWSRNSLRWDYKHFLKHAFRYVDRWRRTLTLEQRCFLSCVQQRVDLRPFRRTLRATVKWFMFIDAGCSTIPCYGRDY